jgi:hypothetical protein
MTIECWTLIVLTFTASFIGWQAWETRKAAQAARTSAEAAERAANHARRTAEVAMLAERAYISLESLEVEAGSNKTVVVMALKNSGRTPADIVEANVTVRTVGPDGTDRILLRSDNLPDQPDYDRDTFVPPANLTAGEITRWRHEINRLNDGSGRLNFQPGAVTGLWIYGYVTYRDRLSPEVPRTYRWAREYDPALSGRERRIMFAHMAKPNYNAAD